MGGERKSALGGLFDFSFRNYITGDVIKLLYGLAIVAILLVYLVIVIPMFVQSPGQGLIVMVVGLFGAFLSLIYVRILLELIMIVFSIHERLSDINASLEQTKLQQ